MIFTNKISISDIISAISVVLVIIGGVFGYYQWRRNDLLKRAGYINELTEKIRSDKYMRDVVYMLDYEKEWYSPQFHGCGRLELMVDKTLSYFSYICYLERYKIITDKEFDFFKYEIKRILYNEQIQDYFYNLYHYSKKFSTPFTFKYLFEYGEKQGLFDADFYDRDAYKKCERYHNNLEF